MFSPAEASPTEVVILVANGFDEEETAGCLHIMRQAGLATQVIGIKTGLITGAGGNAIRPDRSLGDLEEAAALRRAILPGRVQSAMALLADPRVHRLVATAAVRGGYLAVMSRAEEAFASAGLVERLADPSVVGQGWLDTIALSHHLTNLLAA